MLRMAGFVNEWWRDPDDHDIFVHVSEEEGFCIAAAEAMMVGLPVVATAVGELADYSSHDVTAVHVPVGDSDALANSIEKLISDEPRRRRIEVAASHHIEREYGSEQIRARYRSINSRLFGGNEINETAPKDSRL